MDTEFLPAYLGLSNYRRLLSSNERSAPLVIGIGRGNGYFSRYESVVDTEADPETLRYAERIAKFMLWSRGGSTLYIHAPKTVSRSLAQMYSRGGPRDFDRSLMEKIYGQTFEVIEADYEAIPEDHEAISGFGLNSAGCRIGMDLGGSEIKIAGVQDARPIFNTRIPWSPCEFRKASDHYGFLLDVLRSASARLPRVDAIGISTAGVIDEDRLMVSSLTRGLDPQQSSIAQGIFLKLSEEMGVPIKITNDGEAAAVAGRQATGEESVLGITLGTSLACGYIDPQSRLTGRISELAFAPVDLNPAAPTDEWSGDQGVGVSYLSILAVDRLTPKAGISLPPGMPLQERLSTVKTMAMDGDERAIAIYRTIGGYLAGSIPYYAEFYDFSNVVIMGGVTSGGCGEFIIDHANRSLQEHFPEHAAEIKLHLISAGKRRISQAMTAASLPELSEQCSPLD